MVTVHELLLLTKVWKSFTIVSLVFKANFFPFNLFHKFRRVTVLSSINTVKQIHYEAFDREIRLEGHRGIIERGTARIN